MRGDKDQELLNEMAVRYFEVLFTKAAHLDDLEEVFQQTEIPKLNEQQWEELNQPFSSNEMENAMESMHPHKALGSNGFNAAFYQKF